MLLGGGSDLLDYVPSQDYWQAKGVTVTADGLVKELAPPKAGENIARLLVDLGSPTTAVRDAATAKIVAMGPGVLPQLKEASKLGDPEISHKAAELYEQINRSQKATQVRRLMAIRTLGEMKAKEAVTALQGLTNSDEPFVADYAKAALAAIDGKSYERPHPDTSDDAWLMPDKTRSVFHLSFRGGKPIDLDAVMKSMPRPQIAPGGNAPKAPDAAAMRNEAVGHFIEVADRVGNIRLDGITVGLAGEMGPNTGYVVVVAHGQYDAAAVTDLVGGLKDIFKNTKAVGGTSVFSSEGGEVNVLFPSNDRAMLVGGPGARNAGGNVLPIEEMVTAVRKNAGGLKDSKEAAGMAKLLKSVDMKQPLWGAAEVTPTYREAPFLEPFDTITLVGKAAGDKGDSLDFRFDAQGTDPDKVRAAVGMVNQGLDQAKQGMKRDEEHMPPEWKPMLKTAKDLVESMKCQADGKAANLTGSLQQDGTGMLIMSLFMVSPIAQQAPPPQAIRAPAPPPAPVPPQALPR
jgi:hypothetical protein